MSNIELFEHPSEILDRFELRAEHERRAIFTKATGNLREKHSNEKLMDRMQYLQRLVGVCAQRNERYKLKQA